MGDSYLRVHGRGEVSKDGLDDRVRAAGDVVRRDLVEGAVRAVLGDEEDASRRRLRLPWAHEGGSDRVALVGSHRHDADALALLFLQQWEIGEHCERGISALTLKMRKYGQHTFERLVVKNLDRALRRLLPSRAVDVSSQADNAVRRRRRVVRDPLGPIFLERNGANVDALNVLDPPDA